MAKNKLTPEEIKKALECCKPNNDEGCLHCPLSDVHVKECTDILLSESIDLINRQQETIETLRKCVEQHHIIRKDGKSPLSLLTAEIRAEAIKEFAERLKEKAPIIEGLYFKTVKPISCATIDNLVKEMVGEQG